jgi:O-antigen/teichoic acid export membrane protein
MSKFISNVMSLFSASLLALILGVILSPVLSRLYSPEDFGIFQLFFSIVSLIAVVACLSYQSAINLPKKDEDAANIVVLCVCLVGITALISTTILFIFSGTVAEMLNSPSLSDYLFMVPVAVIVNCFAYITGYWLSRKKQFGTIATANLVSSITGKTVSIGSGFLSPSPYGLIVGTIINDATIFLIGLRKIIPDLSLFQNVSYEKVRQQAILYKKFPQFSNPAQLASSAASQSLPFLLAFSFSPIVVGYYSMTFLLVQMPSKLVGNALHSVFYQKASEEKHRTGSITHVVKAVHTRLISGGMIFFLILMIIGPELFEFFLGSQWKISGVYVQILSPWIFLVFISVPLGLIFNVLEKQGADLGFNIVLLISRIFAVLIAGFFGDPILCMVLLSISGVFFWGWMNIYLLKLAGVSVLDSLGDILLFLSLGILVSLPLIVVKILSLSLLLTFSIAIVVTIAYYLIVVYQDPQLKEGLVHFITNIMPKKE